MNDLNTIQITTAEMTDTPMEWALYVINNFIFDIGIVIFYGIGLIFTICLVTIMIFILGKMGKYLKNLIKT